MTRTILLDARELHPHRLVLALRHPESLDAAFEVASAVASIVGWEQADSREAGGFDGSRRLGDEAWVLSVAIGQGGAARSVPIEAWQTRPVPIETIWRPGFELDVWRTLAPLRHGPGDPTIRRVPGGIWRATLTPDGPATLWIAPRAGEVTASAWGAGAERAIAGLPRLLGADDDPGAFQPRHPLLRQLAVRFRGVRFGATDRVLESLIPAICEQKVTGAEAHRAWLGIIHRFGSPAPGSRDDGAPPGSAPSGLRLMPTPETLARLPYYELHPVGLERRRADVIRHVSARAGWLEAAGTLAPPEALARLRALPGIGPWTAAETARTAFGDPDAVSLGDFHTPHVVSWALAGEARGDDTRMLELLEPYQGQRARAVRLLELAGIAEPRFGPRMRPRAIAAL
jgi:3-methyladenine DNA glycosylase/8-oxoguanine DNA glycosylase